MAERERLIEQFPQFLTVAEGEGLLQEICRMSRFEKFKVSDATIGKAFKRIDTLDEESIYDINTTNRSSMSDVLELVFGFSTVKKYKPQRSLRKPLTYFLRNYATFRYFENHPDFEIEEFMLKVGKDEYWHWRKAPLGWCIIIKGRLPENREWGIWRTVMFRSRIEAMKERYELGKKYSDLFEYQIVFDNDRGYTTYPVFPYPEMPR